MNAVEKISWAAADVEDDAPGYPARRAPDHRAFHHAGGIGGQRAVEARRVSLFVPNSPSNRNRARRCALREQLGDRHLGPPQRDGSVRIAMPNLKHDVRTRFVPSLLLCWRDTHPRAAGQTASAAHWRAAGAIGRAGHSANRAVRGCAAPRGCRRGGCQPRRGRHSVYIWAGLAIGRLADRSRSPCAMRGGCRHLDSQNGIPFCARLAFGQRVALLVHHCHREQWPVAGSLIGRMGWRVESWLSPRLQTQPVRDGVPSVGA